MSWLLCVSLYSQKLIELNKLINKYFRNLIKDYVYIILKEKSARKLFDAHSATSV